MSDESSTDEQDFSLSEDETRDSRKLSSSSSNGETVFRRDKRHRKRAIITSDSDSDSEVDSNYDLESSAIKPRKGSKSKTSALCGYGSPTILLSEEDDIIEREAFSPRTRQSITGYWARNSDSQEEESSASNSDDEEVINQTLASISQNYSSKSTGDIETNEQTQGSNQEKSYVSDSDDEVINETLADVSENNSKEYAKNTETNEQKKDSIKDKSSVSNLDDEVINETLKDVFKNSRKYVKNAEANEETKDVKAPAIDTILLDSSTENVDGVALNDSNDSFTASITQKMSSTLSVDDDSDVQEIQKHNTSVSHPICLDSKVVSRSNYENEVGILENLKLQLKQTENLQGSLKLKLSDNGERLIALSKKLKEQIAQKKEFISTLTVQEDLQKVNLLPNVPDWSELSAAVNEVQPKFTGKIGLGTFNTQKLLTIERLKDIHVSLETRPTENILAEQPKHLKTTMMEHQRHALAWMNWRERQKPRGGILADDMGLGKTLTMISLVLRIKENEEVVSEEETSGDDVAAGGWSSKGRRDYFDGGTLVVCPASLVEQWEKEVEKHTKRNSLNVCVHHGNNRETRPRRLAKYDMVFTTYNIVLREKTSIGTVFGIKWSRIILDEAHVIRNHKSLTSVAVCSLPGRCRWALTGTPVQNKEMDLYAILKFLRCSPFDDLGHWKKWVDNKSESGTQRLYTLIQSLMLRRTKVQLQAAGHLQCLPEKSSKLIEVNLQRDEMNVYQRIMLYSRTIFAQYLYQRAEREGMPFGRQTKGTNGTLWKMHQKFAKLQGVNDVQTHQILVLLLRLRQICCHPGLISSMLEEESSDVNHTRSDESDSEIDLLAQLEKLHIEDDSETNPVENTTEVLMQDGAAKASSKILLMSNPVFDLERPSSKVLAVLKVLDEIVFSSGDKAIVVSQWTGVLNIIKVHLAGKRVQTSSLDGTIPVNKRQAIITSFNDPQNSTKVLLLSLTAGGVGLNLVGANHLLLVDLHWNPQLEFQAQDRIYRVGQKKAVHIYKFMCKDTVEEYIKALQEKKLNIANGVLTGSKENQGSKLTIEDLKGLFGMT